MEILGSSKWKFIKIFIMTVKISIFFILPFSVKLNILDIPIFSFHSRQSRYLVWSRFSISQFLVFIYVRPDISYNPGTV